MSSTPVKPPEPEKDRCHGTRQIITHRDDPRGPEFNNAPDSTAGGSVTQCPGCPDCEPTPASPPERCGTCDSDDPKERGQVFEREACIDPEHMWCDDPFHSPLESQPVEQERWVVDPAALTTAQQTNEELTRERDAWEAKAKMFRDYADSADRGEVEKTARAETAESLITETVKEIDALADYVANDAWAASDGNGPNEAALNRFAVRLRSCAAKLKGDT